MVKSRRSRRAGRAWQLFLVAAYTLLGAWTWQLTLLEVFEHHDDLAEECPDDDGDDCDCGPSCHCCVSCAHQHAPVIAPVTTALSPAVATIELTLVFQHSAPPTHDRGPPTKVPKHLA